MGVRKPCTLDGCERLHFARGFCQPHYERWRYHGDPLRGSQQLRTDLLGRFWAKVNEDGPLSETRPELGRCWIWEGELTWDGYGRVNLPSNWKGQRVKIAASVFAYEISIGPIPEGLQIDHLCRVRACVNPSHLEPVTASENNRRGFSPSSINARKTHCKYGHEFTPENVAIYAGVRQCRICNRRRWRETHGKRVAKARG